LSGLLQSMMVYLKHLLGRFQDLTVEVWHFIYSESVAVVLQSSPGKYLIIARNLLKRGTEGVWKRKSLSGVQGESPGRSLGNFPEAGNRYGCRLYRNTMKNKPTKHSKSEINAMKTWLGKNYPWRRGHAPMSFFGYAPCLHPLPQCVLVSSQHWCIFIYGKSLIK